MSSTTTYLQAKQKLARYCSYQERSVAEVRAKLQQYKQLTVTERENIIRELLQERFIDEKRYISAFVNGKFFIKKWGKLKIYQALIKKHIPSHAIQQALLEIPDQTYQETLRQLILQKKATLSNQDSFTIQKKVINYLLQKGYELDLIKEALQEVL